MALPSRDTVSEPSLPSTKTFRSEYFFTGENENYGSAWSLDQGQAAAGSPSNGYNSPVLLGGQQPEMVGPFILGKVLGRGCTGVVRLGTHIETGFQVALKIMKKKHLNSKPKLWQKVRRETAILKLIEHPHVLKLYDVLETPDNLYLVLENVKGGELFDYITRKGRLDREEALRLFAQIVQGLEYCHLHSICHRDLKPENLLLDERGNIKIADFGMAQLMKEGLLNTSCGSPHYASPEVIHGGQYDGKKSDVWSIGVILFALITGSLPFDDDHLPTLLQKVIKGVYFMPPWVPEDIADLISKLLVVDPNKRLPMSQIKYHRAYRGTNYFPPVSPTAPSPATHIRSLLKEPLDEGVLADLEALGWGSADELRKRFLRGEASDQERVFYALLLDRKRDRLQELQRLSPKPQPRPRLVFPPTGQPSSPVTMPSAAVGAGSPGATPPALVRPVTCRRSSRTYSVSSPYHPSPSSPAAASAAAAADPSWFVPAPTGSITAAACGSEPRAAAAVPLIPAASSPFRPTAPLTVAAAAAAPPAVMGGPQAGRDDEESEEEEERITEATGGGEALGSSPPPPLRLMQLSDDEQEQEEGQRPGDAEATALVPSSRSSSPAVAPLLPFPLSVDVSLTEEPSSAAAAGIGGFGAGAMTPPVTPLTGAPLTPPLLSSDSSGRSTATSSSSGSGYTPALIMPCSAPQQHRRVISAPVQPPPGFSPPSSYYYHAPAYASHSQQRQQQHGHAYHPHRPHPLPPLHTGSCSPAVTTPPQLHRQQQSQQEQQEQQGARSDSTAWSSASSESAGSHPAGAVAAMLQLPLGEGAVAAATEAKGDSLAALREFEAEAHEHERREAMADETGAEAAVCLQESEDEAESEGRALFPERGTQQEGPSTPERKAADRGGAAAAVPPSPAPIAAAPTPAPVPAQQAAQQQQQPPKPSMLSRLVTLTTPRFRRRRIAPEEEEEAEQRPRSSPKVSWFASLFQRRPQLDVAGTSRPVRRASVPVQQQQQQRGRAPEAAAAGAGKASETAATAQHATERLRSLSDATTMTRGSPL